MGYPLSAEQRSELTDLKAQIENPTHAYYGQYWRAYAFIRDAATVHGTTFDSPVPEVDQGTWLWLRGATLVNQGVGVFSTFIREYTKAQYLLRTGNTASDALIQQASDDIAKQVIADSLSSEGVPDVMRIGRIDAGRVVGALYGDQTDFSSWSGVPLYLTFGKNDFFTQHILDQKNGTYDVFALAEAFGAAASASGITFSLDGWLGLLQAGVYNGTGLGPTVSTITSALESITPYLQQTYGDFGPTFWDLPLAEIKLGRNTQQGDELSGTSDDDIVHAGVGGDTVIAGTGHDVFEGGEGTDRLTYGELGAPTTVSLQGTPSGKAILVVDKGTRGNDVAANFEELILGSSKDIFKVGPKEQLGAIFGSAQRLSVDGGDQPTGDGDVLEFSGYGAPIEFESGKLKGFDLEFKNFERLRTSNSADEIKLDRGGFGTDGKLKGVFGSLGQDNLNLGGGTFQRAEVVLADVHRFWCGAGGCTYHLAPGLAAIRFSIAGKPLDTRIETRRAVASSEQEIGNAAR